MNIMCVMIKEKKMDHSQKHVVKPMTHVHDKGPNTQNAISVANCQATRKTEIKTKFLLVTVHTERDKISCRVFTANLFSN